MKRVKCTQPDLDPMEWTGWADGGNEKEVHSTVHLFIREISHAAQLAAGSDHCDQIADAISH